VSLSTAEAEYIAAGSSCSQLVWMKQMLKEYNVEQDVLTLYCDNLSVINIPKNPIQHSRTKHIDIQHHFIRDLVEEKVVTLEHVDTEEQLADIFTKALDAKQFENLRKFSCMRKPNHLQCEMCSQISALCMSLNCGVYKQCCTPIVLKMFLFGIFYG
jgi:hypothetical protein